MFAVVHALDKMDGKHDAKSTIAFIFNRFKKSMSWQHNWSKAVLMSNLMTGKTLHKSQQLVRRRIPDESQLNVDDRSSIDRSLRPSVRPVTHEDRGLCYIGFELQ